MPKFHITNAKDLNLRHGQQIHIPIKRKEGPDGSHFVTVSDPGIKYAPVGADGSTSLPVESDVKQINCSADHAAALKEQGFELEELDEDDTSRPASSAGVAKPDVDVEDDAAGKKPRDPFESAEDRDAAKQKKLVSKLQSQATAEERALRESAAERDARIAENRALAEKGADQANKPPSKEDVAKEPGRKR